MPITSDRRYIPPSAPKAKAKPPVTKVPNARSGKSDPWSYGPFRVVAQRRVSEEEQLSVECYAPTVEEARSTLGVFLLEFRRHMIAYNEQVVLTQQKQLQQIEQLIEERGQEARRIEAEIAGLIAQKQDAAHPDEDTADADQSA